MAENMEDIIEDFLDSLDFENFTIEDGTPIYMGDAEDLEPIDENYKVSLGDLFDQIASGATAAVA